METEMNIEREWWWAGEGSGDVSDDVVDEDG